MDRIIADAEACDVGGVRNFSGIIAKVLLEINAILIGRVGGSDTNKLAGRQQHFQQRGGSVSDHKSRLQ